MFSKDVHDVLHLIFADVLVRNCGLVVISFSIVVSLFFSAITAIITFLSYIFGFIICWLLIKYQNSTAIYLQRFVSFYWGSGSNIKRVKISCSICNDTNCKRHKKSARCPWKDLYISEDLNDAIEHFFNTILQNFISSWYHNFTNDVTFINELRMNLRYATATITSRLLEIDLSVLIANKLLPCAVKHIDDYLCMQQNAKLKNIEFNNIAVSYLGKRLHIAATNRQNELTYLQYLSSHLLLKVLPTENSNCRNFSVLIREIISGWVLLPLMDIIADPNIINSLILLIASYKSKGSTITNYPKNVVFLHNFENKKNEDSALAVNLKATLKTVDLLYAFMQFLKKDGPVNILQFCLDAEEFNNKLLTPELSKKQLENLHGEALNLYKTYFDPKCSDFIGCSSEIVTDLQHLLQAGVDSVLKLRTTKPLFQAYEYAFNQLETEWLPVFYHSNEFYNYICGSKITPTYAKAGTKGRKYYESSSQGTVAKISSGLGKIKGALRTNQPIEGAVYHTEIKYSLENGSTPFVENIIILDCPTIFRDLSAWRVSIPSMEMQYGGSRSTCVFNIHVQRIDTLSENESRHWVVQRKDQDFHILKTKLIEFHGENEICNSPLPSKRSSVPAEKRRSKYEEFLRALLQKPTLRGSDLLHTFLTIEQDFTLIVATTVPTVGDLGNIYQSVTYKLRKEKGQYLDSFMNTFLASTGKTKQNKFEWAEIGDELDVISLTNGDFMSLPKTFVSSVFNDNFGVPYKKTDDTLCTSLNPSGISECIFYLLKHAFKVSTPILKLFIAMCNIANSAVDSICHLLIDRLLRKSLSQTNLAYLIGLLEDVIFHTHSSSKKSNYHERKTKAFEEVEQCIPGYLEKVLGNDCKKGIIYLFEMLQNPLYNKQLAYNFLDIIVAEMYPSLDTNENL